jgi:hypothetical protein
VFKAAFLPILALVISLLAGCANTAAKRTQNGLELDLLADANKGFVVLKVITTRPISLINPKWQSIKISSQGRGAELMDITPYYNMFMGSPVPTESLYFAKIDAGEYEITGMGSVGPGPGLLLAMLASDSATADRKLPKFTVVSGRLSNLGTIVYVPEIDKEQPERMFLLGGTAGKQAAKNALLAESKRTDISLIDGGGWLTTPDEAEVLKQVRPLVSMFSFQKSDQGLFAVSHLGQVLRRTGIQTWSSEPIETLDRLFVLTQMPDGKFIVGSEYGEYFVKDAVLGWRAYRLGKENSRVVQIIPRQGIGTFFVLTDGLTTRLLLKKSIEDQVEAPVEVLQLNEIVSNLLVTQNEIIFAHNVPGITREVVLKRVDMRTLAVSSKSENFWVAGWQYMPSGEIKLTRQNGLSLYSSTSTDNLQTWTKDDVPVAFGAYWFDAANGLSLEVTTGIVMVNSKLRKTTDGGRSWSTYGNSLETKYYSGQIVFADDSEVLIQGSHMLYSTTDHGQTWKRVFPLN